MTSETMTDQILLDNTRSGGTLTAETPRRARALRVRRPGSWQQDRARRRLLSSLGTTVAVWAHPDDETYLAGGLLAALRDAGQRVVCVSATRGDAGNGLHDGGSTKARSELAAIRTGELRAALDVLGVLEHHWLGYSDTQCPQVPVESAADRLVQIFEEVQPRTVVSFGPDGFTGHADHCAVADWSQRAVRRWQPRPQLLQVVTGRQDREAARDIDECFQSYGWAFPPSVQEENLTVRVVLSGAELERKVEALRQQRSQTAELMEAVGEDRFAAWVSAESFRRA